MDAAEFLLRLLDHHPPALVDFDDLHGRFAALLAACQAAGFLPAAAALHPDPTCEHCGEGLPHGEQGPRVCAGCFSVVGPGRLRCRVLSLPAFLAWLSGQLGLRGEARPVDAGLWQLGTHDDDGRACECFYSLGGPLTEAGRQRLLAYRNAAVLYALRRPSDVERLHASLFSLLGLVSAGETLRVRNPLAGRSVGAVRFDPETGGLSVGGSCCGVLPPGSREHALLAALAARQGEFVAYADLKRDILAACGGGSERDEASFCHRLKNRIKQRHVTRIGALVVASSRGDGYRLATRGEV